MRRLAVVLTLIVLLGVSLGIAKVAVDWPQWCRALHWCDGRGVL